jgi:hypothetical protein
MKGKRWAAVNDCLDTAELIDYLLQRNFSLETAGNLAGEIVSYAAEQKRNCPN